MSLRVRLVAGLLALAALGLLLLGGITYAEQRSFLYDRADQQARQAVFPVRHRLDDLGVSGLGRAPGRPPDGDGDNRGGGPEDVSLPPGTYGEARSATGTALRRTVLAYGDRTPPRPDLPADLEPGTMRTVDAVEGHLRYRVFAAPSFGGETTIAAVPLREVDSTLHRLLLVEGLVIAGILAALAIVASWLVPPRLRPPHPMGETARPVAGGGPSHPGGTPPPPPPGG